MKILILGASGFLGSKIKKRLETEHQVYTFDRSSGGSNHYQGNILSATDLSKAIADKDLVINTVGLSPIIEPKISYEQVHVQGVKNIIQAINSQQIQPRLLQISALGVEANIDTRYHQTKLAAEGLIQQNIKSYLIVRPSLIFGEGMELAKMFSPLLKLKFMPIPNIESKQQPIFIEDLVESIAENAFLEGSEVLNIAGPQVLSFREFLTIYAKSQHAFTLTLPKALNPLIQLAPYLPLLNFNHDFGKFLNLDVILANQKGLTHTGRRRFEDSCKEIYDNKHQ